MLHNAERFFEMGAFPGVVGAVDGTHIGIIPPSDEARVYKNRKGNYSINVQVNKEFIYFIYSIMWGKIIFFLLI